MGFLLQVQICTGGEITTLCNLLIAYSDVMSYLWYSIHRDNSLFQPIHWASSTRRYCPSPPWLLVFLFPFRWYWRCTSAMGSRLWPRCPSPLRRRAAMLWSSAKSPARAAATWLRSGEATVRPCSTDCKSVKCTQQCECWFSYEMQNSVFYVNRGEKQLHLPSCIYI